MNESTLVSDFSARWETTKVGVETSGYEWWYPGSWPNTHTCLMTCRHTSSCCH